MIKSKISKEISIYIWQGSSGSDPHSLGVPHFYQEDCWGLDCFPPSLFLTQMPAPFTFLQLGMLSFSYSLFTYIYLPHNRTTESLNWNRSWKSLSDTFT